MGKSKTPETEERVLDELTEEPVVVKGPLRDDPAPEYEPQWEVVNDRQNILADKLPPKIYSIEALVAAGVINETALAAYLASEGYVKKTDYASKTVGGVIKVDDTNYGVRTNASGELHGAPFTLSNYINGSNNLLVSKATLENVLLPIVKTKIQTDMGAVYENADIGSTWTVILRKTEDGLVFDYAPTE